MLVEARSANGDHPLLSFLNGREFSFDLVLPQPIQCLVVSRPIADSHTGLVYPSHRYTPRNERGNEAERELTPQQHAWLMEKLGPVDWYDWNNENWGTKWDIKGNCRIEKLSGSEVELIFETAWAPPSPVAKKLSEVLVGCQVTLDYMEPGCDFGGREVYVRGVRVSEQSTTARESRDISEWHELTYGPNDDEEEEDET